MKLLYSNILPLGTKEGQKTIIEAFNENIAVSDRVEIAVGYISRASLLELDSLVKQYNIQNICLNIGMYMTEGMPESMYNTAKKISAEWKAKGGGEIRMIKTFKYHGKIYCFYKDGKVFASILGSANLGVIKTEANNMRQYEVAILSEDENECSEIADLLTNLKQENCSTDIDSIDGIKLIQEPNTSLQGIELVKELPKTEIALYEQYKTETRFVLPLKVPAKEERFMDDGKHYTKSNINVCYAAPRSSRKNRDWFETQITVSSKIYKQEGYPEKNCPFLAVTDDGYCFKVHTTSDNNKQFSAVGDELILGRWLKGRLAAAGIVPVINDTGKDIERKGMITKEMLEAYNAKNIIITKTTCTAIDPTDESKELDVWLMEFANE